MIDDLIHNPVLAVRVILGDESILDMPPHERIRFKIAWTAKFTLDSSGFSTAKSFSIAALAALRIVLLDSERIEGVVSKTFGQGKLVGKYWEKWLGTSKIFASQIRKRPSAAAGMEYDFNRGPTGWELVSRNGSIARIVPPDLMKEGGRLASERFSDGYFDEIHKWPEQSLLEMVMFPRVSKPVSKSDDPIYQRHIYCSCTARFKYHPAYKRVEDFQNEMNNGNAKYAVMSFNFRDVPDKPEYRALVEMDTLKMMERTLPKALFQCEALGEWVSDSEGFYTASMINTIRHREVKVQSKRLHNDEEFVCGIDIAHGGQYGQGDDSAIQVLRRFHGITTHVWAEAMHSVRLEQISGMVHKLNRLFGFSVIVLDPLGGGLFLMDSLVNETQLIDGEWIDVTPIACPDEERVVHAHRTLTLFKASQPYISHPEAGIFPNVGKEPSVLINRAHTEFQATLEHERIAAPIEFELEEESVLEHLSKHPDLVKCRQTIDDTYLELIGIERAKGEDGKIKLDKYGMMQFTTKIQKDRAYALVYAHIALLILDKLGKFDEDGESTGDAPIVTEVDYSGGKAGVLPNKKHDGDFSSVTAHYI
jgi:hypothetical protein